MKLSAGGKQCRLHGYNAREWRGPRKTLADRTGHRHFIAIHAVEARPCRRER